MVKNVVKKVTVRLTEEEKSAVIMLAKEENKSVQNFIYDRIMPAQNQQNADVKNDELVADLKRQLQKREEEIQNQAPDEFHDSAFHPSFSFPGFVLG